MVGAQRAGSRCDGDRTKKSLGGWSLERLELALRLGVSPRRLEGWEPREFTEYEYEPRGFVSRARWRWLRTLQDWLWTVAHPPQMLRSVTYREPEWSTSDVAALAAAVEMGRVGPHGQPMSEATSPLANPQNPNREWDYDVEVWTDFAAKRKSEYISAFKKRYGDDANLDELVFTVKKVDRHSARVV